MTATSTVSSNLVLPERFICNYRMNLIQENAKKVSGAAKSTSKRIPEERISDIGNGSAAAVDHIPSNSQKITPTAGLSSSEVSHILEHRFP